MIITTSAVAAQAYEPLPQLDLAVISQNQSTGTALASAGASVTTTISVGNPAGSGLTARHVTATWHGGVAFACDATELVPGETTSCVSTEPVRGTDASAAAGGTIEIRADGFGLADLVIGDPPLGVYLWSNVSGEVEIGQNIEYTIVVENLGDQTAHGVWYHLAKPVQAGGAQLAFDCDSATSLSIPPRGKVECHSSDGGYTATVSDLPMIRAIVVAGGTAGRVVRHPDPAAAAIVLEQSVDTVDVDGDGLIGAGDTATVEYLITNTGNVDLTGAAIDSTLLAGAAVEIDCGDGVLPVDGELACRTATPYEFTASDAAAGHVEFDAMAVAADASGSVLSSPVADHVALAAQADPADDPSEDPTGDPADDPTGEPTGDPNDDPTGDPANGPGGDPARDPESDGSSDPTTSPSTSPAATPTKDADAPGGDAALPDGQLPTVGESRASASAETVVSSADSATRSLAATGGQIALGAGVALALLVAGGTALAVKRASTRG